MFAIQHANAISNMDLILIIKPLAFQISKIEAALEYSNMKQKFWFNKNCTSCPLSLRPQKITETTPKYDMYFLPIETMNEDVVECNSH